MVASGALAKALLMETQKEAKATRIDVVVDMMLEKRDLNIFEEIEEQFTQEQLLSKGEIDSRLIKSKQGGWTYYRGKRGEGMMLRIYDKGAKEDGRNGLWIRWELQVGRKYATRARDAIIDSVDRQDRIKGILNKFCMDRDILSPIDDVRNVQWIASASIVDDSDEKERAVTWFRGTVAPFVKRFKSLVSDEYILRELGYQLYIDAYEIELSRWTDEV